MRASHETGAENPYPHLSLPSSSGQAKGGQMAIGALHGAIHFRQRWPRSLCELDLDADRTGVSTLVEDIEDLDPVDLAFARRREIPFARAADMILGVQMHEIGDRRRKIVHGLGAVVVEFDVGRVVVDAD